MEGNIIPTASEYEKLLQEISVLQAEIVRLTALRDDLVYRICPSLRAIYEEEIGSIEREILAAQLYLQEKKRILELLRAQLNRREQMSYQKAAQQAEEEKKEYEEELKRRAKEAEEFHKRWQNKNWSSYGYEGSGEDTGSTSGAGASSGPGASAGTGSAAGDGAGNTAGGSADGSGTGEDTGAGGSSGTGETSGTGSSDGGEGNGSKNGGGEDGEEKLSIAQRIKRLYRKIVKRLHPDVRPDLSAHEKDLFQQAQTAYERGDLETLERIWQELEGMNTPEETFADTPEDIEKMKVILENLKKLIRELQREITSIRSEFPYTIRELLENEELLGEKKAALQKQLQEIREANDSLVETIEQLREKLNQ
ncbi:MAG: hypothetical protein IJI10_03355 [Eubacterium sp.]|nr:hypothetical protein [Eubacterium sp.]